MALFDGEEFGRIRVDQLSSLIEKLESLDIHAGHAKRFLKAGEWGFSFKEIYYAAIADEDVYRELEPLNNFLAKYKYYADHLGFPLG